MSIDASHLANLANVGIAIASAEDLSAICAIEQECFRIPWDNASIKNELTELSWSRTLVAKKEQQTVGYLCFWTVVDEFQILKVAVRKPFRNQRIAEKLIQAVIEMGKTENIALITLELRQSNQAAKRLYEKVRFQVAGVRPRYYTDTNEDAILMNFEFQPTPRESKIHR